MGFGLMTAGFILLFNPVIMFPVFGDILPDAVGFFLIAAGLTRLSSFIGKLAEAREGFIRLAFLEMGKFLAMLSFVRASGTAKPLVALVAGLLEAMLFIPAVLNLFEGLSFAGLWYGGTAIYAKKTVTRGGGTREIENAAALKRYMIFFYLFRIAATLIPELSELQMYDYLGTVDRRAFDMVYFKPLFYILFSAAVCVFGAVYIVRVVRFFRSLKQDRPFINALEDKYRRDVMPKTGYFIAKRMKLVLALFAFAACTSLIFPLDNINVLPGFISSGFLIAAAVLMLRYEKTALWAVVLSAVRCGLAVLNLVRQILYFNDYSADAVLRVTEAYNRYYGLAMTEVAEYLFALASVLVFAVALMKAVKAHLEIMGIQTDNAMYSKRNRDLETYNVIGGKLLLTSVLAILHYVAACAYRYLLVDFSLVLVVTTAVTLIYAAYAVYSMRVIDTLLYDKEIELM